MKSRDEIDAWIGKARLATSRCVKCRGANLRCECNKNLALESRLFEACVPREFWHKQRSDVWFNREVFEDVILPYMDKIVEARRAGAGIFLVGPNGCGKTMFMSMILERVLRGPLSAYYTSMPDLAQDLARGFRNEEIRERLEAYMTSDFVVFDEVGKESWKEEDSFVRVHVERWAKDRWIRGLPTLWASNATLDVVCRPPEAGGYGETIRSLVNGRSMTAPMKPGDQRLREGESVRSKIWGSK